jgi:hypothetical protein
MKNKWTLPEPYLIEKTDDRYNKFLVQHKTRGFCDSETWSLDSVICKFILPRLKRFRELNTGFPYGLTENEWDAILEEMIFAFEWNINEEAEILQKLSQEENKKNWERQKKGIELFAKYFGDLWW